MPPPSATHSQIATFRTTIVDGSATALFTVDLPSAESTGGIVFFKVYATDGTDYQVISGLMTFAAVNKAGTITRDETYATANEAKAVSAGTLTLAFTVTDDTNKITVKLQPTGSLTETTYYVDWSCTMLDPDHYFMPS